MSDELEDPLSPVSGNGPEEEGLVTAVWEDIKRRTQGAFGVLSGKSAAVDYQQLWKMLLSHVIMQDDLADAKARHIEDEIAYLPDACCTPEAIKQIIDSVHQRWGIEAVDQESKREIDRER